MLFKIGDQIINTETTPVGLVFKNQEEANTVASIISSIKDGNLSEFPTDGNGRWWFMTPAAWTMQQKDAWSVLTDEQKELLEKTQVKTGKLDFEL